MVECGVWILPVPSVTWILQICYRKRNQDQDQEKENNNKNSAKKPNKTNLKRRLLTCRVRARHIPCCTAGQKLGWRNNNIKKKTPKMQVMNKVVHLITSGTLMKVMLSTWARRGMHPWRCGAQTVGAPYWPKTPSDIGPPPRGIRECRASAEDGGRVSPGATRRYYTEWPVERKRERENDLCCN